MKIVRNEARPRPERADSIPQQFLAIPGHVHNHGTKDVQQSPILEQGRSSSDTENVMMVLPWHPVKSTRIARGAYGGPQICSVALCALEIDNTSTRVDTCSLLVAK